MKRKPRVYKFIAALLALGFALCLSACGTAGYREIEDLGETDLCLAFRYEDKLASTLNAALSETIASGEAGKLSLTYFGEDKILAKGSSDAIASLEELAEERTLIMGIVVSGKPYAYYDGGNLTGFIPELARAIGSQLGWGITFQEITPSDACAQLGSGNIDCAVCLSSSVFSLDSYTLSDPVIHADYALAAVSGSSASSFHSLKNESIALIDGDSVTESLLSSYAEMQKYSISIQFYDSADAAVNAVANGDSQAVAMDTILLEYAMAGK